MPLHPQAAAFLQRRRDQGIAPDYRLSIEQVRTRADISPSEVEVIASTRDVLIAGPGGDLRLRVTTPAMAAESSPAARVPVGVVLYMHGGGHVTGTVDSYDGLTRRLANRAGAVVVSVDYRRAPEHRCPAAVDDAEAAYDWVVDHLDELLAEVPQHRRRVVIAGDSAGGNNTAVLARRLRDRTTTTTTTTSAGLPGPNAIGSRAPARQPPLQQPALQVLLYPTLDAVAYRGGTEHLSYSERGTGCGLTYRDGLYYWDHYLGPGGDPASPEASPLRVQDMTGLAPAYVLTVEYDVLRDEGFAYAAALVSAGVAVTHRHFEHHLHGFLGDPDAYEDADPALLEVAAAVRAALMNE